MDRRPGGRGRIARIAEAAQASFGVPAGVAMLAGILLGLGLPALDGWLEVDVPALSFDSQSSARSLLETIGTTTVAVAGLSFSVTVVAFTLASSQLSPRVLRSFRSDRLSQLTLAALLGTFVYSLTLLVRLGVSESPDPMPPNLSITLAVLLAFASFAMFAGFIGHIVNMLQPSTVIATIRSDARSVLEHRYPSGQGEPEDPVEAAAEAKRMVAGAELHEVCAERAGYLTLIDIGPVVDAASAAQALVRQRARIGAYVLPGEVLVEAWVPPGADVESLEDSIRAAVDVDTQRTLVQDSGFPVRQLADIALKGLSPGINDPTTAVNALEGLGAMLTEFCRSEEPTAVRVDGDGVPRFLAAVPDLNDLVRDGFEQIHIYGAEDSVVVSRTLGILDHLKSVADAEGMEAPEIDRQRRLLAAGHGEEQLPGG